MMTMREEYAAPLHAILKRMRSTVLKHSKFSFDALEEIGVVRVIVSL